MPVLAERKKGRARASRASSPPTTTVAIGKGESASLVQQCSCGAAIDRNALAVLGHSAKSLLKVIGASGLTAAARLYDSRRQLQWRCNPSQHQHRSAIVD